MPNVSIKNKYGLRICILYIFLTIVFMVPLFPVSCQAKTTKPKWKKEISSLRIGKTFHYHVKGISKKTKIYFSSNHVSRASIQRKTGLLRAKKSGDVVITAKIQRPHKKIKKLRTKVKIIAKKNTNSSLRSNDTPITQADTSANPSNTHDPFLLDHVKFTVSKTINPWNHSLMLYSNRILLQSEVQNSTLTLSRITEKNAQNNAIKLTAQFSSLSKDGKTITYHLSDSSAQKICPGNGTQNGDYRITSAIFSGELQTHYQERIQPNSICGFAITEEGTALADVSITLSSSTSNIPLATTKSDHNGYYQFRDVIEKEIKLTAQLKNYDTFSLSPLHPEKQMLCQNIIMHPASTDKLTISCLITNSQEQPVTNATVMITDNQQNPLTWGEVDPKGQITFTNHDITTDKGYTMINYQNMISTPKYQKGKMPIADTILRNDEHPFSRNQQYRLYVIPATNGSSIPKDYHMVSFTFSFASLLSDQLFLQIHLQTLPIISVEKISINTDQISESFSYLDYLLYDNHGNRIFHTTLPSLTSHHDSNYSDSLSNIMQNHVLRLYDGKYYTSITAYSSKGQPISTTTILPVYIKNGILRPTTYSLTPAKVSRSLIYAKFPKDISDQISFDLYQKSDTIYFPIGKYTSDHLISITDSTSKAYLDLNVLQPNTTYCLVPDNTDYTISSGAIFHTSSNTDDNVANPIPNHQIILTNTSVQNNITENLFSGYDLSNYFPLCIENQNLDSKFFASATSYPNTIYAYYQPDGKFTNMFFATPAFLLSNDDFSMTTIYNRLQNENVMYTSQASYRMTPFFVT